MEDVYIISIVFGFAAFVCTGIYKLIKTKLQKNDGVDTETLERLAHAFMQHKKEMRQRVENLEAIITDKGEKDQYPQIEEPQNQGTLTNDLRQKDNVKS